MITEYLELENHIIQCSNFTLSVETKQPTRVVITVPHDGLPKSELVGFSSPRENGIRGRDKHVWPIVRDLILGTSDLEITKYISIIRGLMWRGFIDYNRSWPQGINYYPLTKEKAQTALEDPKLVPAYHTYHNKIQELVARSLEYYGNGGCLLLDMHGFCVQPPFAPEPFGYDLVLGTGNRSTIPYGAIDLEMGRYLQEKGYSVFVPAEKNPEQGPAEDLYSADFTTHYYSETFNINAIQVEVAPWFRNRDGTERGQRLSQDLAQFLEAYLL